MKLSINCPDGQKVYVAELRGLHPRYRFDRDFLEPERPQGKSKKRTYHLEGGLFEISEDGNRRYLAIVNNRSIEIQADDLVAVVDLAEKNEAMFDRIFATWEKSRKRSSSSLVSIAKKLMEPVLDERKKKQRQRQSQQAAYRKDRIRRMTAKQAFNGSDAAVTRGFLKRLESCGQEGVIAAALFRCQKASTRAKMYRGSHRDLAYDRKSEVMETLCQILDESGTLRFGWKIDPLQDYAPWVLYVDLPLGQVSFHSLERGTGPDYPGVWDRESASESRIVAFCDDVLSEVSGSTGGVVMHSESQS